MHLTELLNSQNGHSSRILEIRDLHAQILMRAKTADIQSSPHMAKRALGLPFIGSLISFIRAPLEPRLLPKDSRFPVQCCGDVRIEQTDLGVLVHLRQCTPCWGRAGRFRSSFSQPWPFNCIILSRGTMMCFSVLHLHLIVHFSRHPIKFLEALYIIQLPLWQRPLLLTWSGSHSRSSHIFRHFILGSFMDIIFFPTWSLYIAVPEDFSPGPLRLIHCYVSSVQQKILNIGNSVNNRFSMYIPSRLQLSFLRWQCLNLYL